MQLVAVVHSMDYHFQFNKMNYELKKEENINNLFVPTDTQWGMIYFNWEDSNQEFVNALNAKGIEVFIELLIADPNTAYLLFVNG